MKIKLITTPPVHSKHGLTKDRIMEAILVNDDKKKPYYWVIGDIGEKVGILQHEAVPVREES